MMHKNYSNVLNENDCVYRTGNQRHSKVQCPKSCLQGNTEQITHRLSADSYQFRPLCHRKHLKMVYYTYFHSIMNYGLIFWRNSSHIAKIFRIQKYIIRIITECRSRLMQRFKNSTSSVTIYTITSLTRG
jgi:hypothetical protein